MMRTSKRLAGTMALAAGLMVAGVAEAQPAPGAQNCNITYTDCAGLHWNRTWQCTQGKSCCTITLKDDGADNTQGTSDDCIVSVEISCGPAGLDCNTVEWLANP